MKEIFDCAVKRFGCGAVIHRGGTEVPVTVFLQAVTSLDKRYYGDKVTMAGVLPAMRYMYMGPAGESIDGCTISCRGETFVPVSSAVAMAGGEAVCVWAVLRRTG